jgi:hypothetical protein
LADSILPQKRLEFGIFSALVVPDWDVWHCALNFEDSDRKTLHKKFGRPLEGDSVFIRFSPLLKQRASFIRPLGWSNLAQPNLASPRFHGLFAVLCGNHFFGIFGNHAILAILIALYVLRNVSSASLSQHDTCGP